MSFQTAHLSQKLEDSMGTGQRNEQTVTNEGRFKLFDVAVGGRTVSNAPSTWCLSHKTV